MNVERVSTPGASAPHGNDPVDIEGFISKIDGGMDLESLIMADTLMQRKVGREMRKACREMQKKALEAAIKKIKAAASDRIWSTVVGAALDTFVSLCSYKLCDASGQFVDNTAKLGYGLVKAGSEVLKAVNPFELKATADDCSAKRLEQASNMEAGRAGDAKDLIQSARDLEQRMLAVIDRADQGEHQARLDLARRIGE
jgi:hypothetical protein